MSNPYTTISEWETYEGTSFAYNDLGDCVIEIEPILNREQCARWNETYRPGRTWYVTHEDGTIARGHARDLREAKKHAIAVLTA